MAGNIACWASMRLCGGVRIVYDASFESTRAQILIHASADAAESSRHATCGIRLVFDL